MLATWRKSLPPGVIAKVDDTCCTTAHFKTSIRFVKNRFTRQDIISIDPMDLITPFRQLPATNELQTPLFNETIRFETSTGKMALVC